MVCPVLSILAVLKFMVCRLQLMYLKFVSNTKVNVNTLEITNFSDSLAPTLLNAKYRNPCMYSAILH